MRADQRTAAEGATRTPSSTSALGWTRTWSPGASPDCTSHAVSPRCPIFTTILRARPFCRAKTAHSLAYRKTALEGTRSASSLCHKITRTFTWYPSASPSVVSSGSQMTFTLCSSTPSAEIFVNPPGSTTRTRAGISRLPPQSVIRADMPGWMRTASRVRKSATISKRGGYPISSSSHGCVQRGYAAVIDKQRGPRFFHLKPSGFGSRPGRCQLLAGAIIQGRSSIRSFLRDDSLTEQRTGTVEIALRLLVLGFSSAHQHLSLLKTGQRGADPGFEHSLFTWINGCWIDPCERLSSMDPVPRMQ